MIKSCFDFLVSITAFILLSPILLILAILVRIRLGSPIFFRQERPGLHGKSFYLLKFRTMTDKKDSAGKLLPDEKRLTTFGKFLRSTSLDELPTLLNVVKGDLSLVGPRPLLVSYLPRYSERHRHRHDVKPGITGWAQVNGRNAIGWHQKFELDLWYVENQSFLLDLKILFMTVLKVVRKDGISSNNHATMPEFTGYDQN